MKIKRKRVNIQCMGSQKLQILHLLFASCQKAESTSNNNNSNARISAFKSAKVTRSGARVCVAASTSNREDVSEDASQPRGEVWTFDSQVILSAFRSLSRPVARVRPSMGVSGMTVWVVCANKVKEFNWRVLIGLETSGGGAVICGGGTVMGGVCEFERKHPFRISHEGGPERAKVCGGWANGGVDNSCVEVVKSSVDL